MIGEFLRNELRDVATQKISIGVTGFSRAGKTVFIGSLAQALLTAEAWKSRRGQGALAQFGPFERDQFKYAHIRDDLHNDKPQFPFRKVRDALIGSNAWPQPTEGLSRLVIDLEGVPKAAFRNWLAVKGGMQEVGLGRVQLELIDYPGEWLVDLPMLQMDFVSWSADMLERAQNGPRKLLSQIYFKALSELPQHSRFDEEWASRLSEDWTNYLQLAVKQGLVMNQPGRLLRPDKLAGSPVLRLVPLPISLVESDFYRRMRDRYESYKKSVISPFYKEHFSKIDRQIVLVDVLRTLQNGEDAFTEMTDAMTNTLRTFNYSKGGWLSRLAGAKTTHVLFAATKADHVTRGDRINLEELLKKMLTEVDGDKHLRANSLQSGVMALASIRATEDRITTSAPHREILSGQRRVDDKADQWDPGGLPLDFPPNWSQMNFEFLDFAPMPMADAKLDGFPSINLGKALNFLIGEDFR